MAKKQYDPDDQRLRIHQIVAQKLGTLILSGTIEPGGHLPGEIEQSAAMGVSRTAYREAIRILSAKGLLESKPKTGTHVTPRERWNLLDPDMLAWMFMGSPDERFVSDLFELRSILEPKAAEMAAVRRTTAQIEAMREAVDDMRVHGLATPQGRAADQKFHTTLLSATGNAAMATLASSIGAAVQWTTDFKQRASTHARDPLAEHVAVFEAILASDPAEARAAMNNLIKLALADMAVT